ncbi:MAG: hypothetical protein R3C05_22370 [Pirellulaceae bacterium]
MYAYQYDAGSGQWQPLQLLARDTAADTLTVRAKTAAPIVLGHDVFGAGVVPDDGQPLATVDFEVYHAMLGGETIFGAGIDFRTDDPRVEGDDDQSEGATRFRLRNHHRRLGLGSLRRCE